MEFLTPWGFVFGVTILGPLALHLWSRGPRRRVRVGSVRLLASAMAWRMRRLKLHDPLLLALRAALLALLALLLASPRLVRDGRERGWVLVEPGAGQASKIQALADAGNPVHWLTPGFPEWSAASQTPMNGSAEGASPLPGAGGARLAGAGASEGEGEGEGRGSAPSPRQETSSPGPLWGFVWGGVRQADAMDGIGARLWVFTAGRLDSFSGVRPTLGFRVDWFAPPRGDWTTKPVPQPSRRLRVGLAAASDRKADARFVAAALRAGFASDSLELLEADAERWPDMPVDFLVWLSDAPPPKFEPRLEDRGAGESVQSWILLRGQEGRAAPGLHKLDRAELGGEPIWRDGFGRPVLERLPGRCVMHGRFNPEWSELAAHPAFPEALRRVVLPEPEPPPGLAIAEAQARAHGGSGQGKRLLQDVDRSLWLGIWLLFLLERAWAARRWLQ